MFHAAHPVPSTFLSTVPLSWAAPSLVMGKLREWDVFFVSGCEEECYIGAMLVTEFPEIASAVERRKNREEMCMSWRIVTILGPVVF